MTYTFGISRLEMKIAGYRCGPILRGTALVTKKEIVRTISEEIGLTQLKTKEKGGITLKVSEKGAVSLYGMGKFPVTLYKEQWLRVLASAPQIEAFIRENDAKLKTKE